LTGLQSHVIKNSDCTHWESVSGSHGPSAEEFPLTWLERCLQPLAIRFLKKWVGLAQPSNTAILFLRGGLALPSLVSLYKKQQSSRMVQLFTPDDPGVRREAHLLLQEEERAQRTRFKPAVFVNEIRAVHPSI